VANANQEYFDAAIRHQIGIRRFTAGEVKRIIRNIEKADQDLSKKLRRKLKGFEGKPANFSTLRWKALVKDLRTARKIALGSLSEQLKPSLRELAKLEIDFEQRMMEATIPVQIEFAAVALEKLNDRVFKKPFSGGTASAKNLSQWFDSLRKIDQARTIEALQLGIIQGETVDEMMRRIAGTKARGFTDGVLSLTRSNAETIVRTAVNHVSNASRELVWETNDDVVSFLRWTSTLDGRTSAICRARDGHLVAVGDDPIPAGEPKLKPEYARPPAHPNCRSLMVGVFDIDGIIEVVGERPFVRGNKRQLDFRQAAKDRIGAEQWKALSPSERNSLIKFEKKAWARVNIGTVPAATTYQQWLKRQPSDFQEEVLGKTKAKLFRDGGLTLDRFVDRRGNELNLAELSRKDPTAFVDAGLDPDKF